MFGVQFLKSDKETLADILQETDFQPESHGYYVFEILNGTYVEVCQDQVLSSLLMVSKYDALLQFLSFMLSVLLT